MAGAHSKYRYADEIQHHGRHVEHVVSPVTPARKKSVEVTEDFLSPQVHPTFAGISMGQFDNSNSLRPEKEQQGDHPEPDGDASVGGDGGHHVQIENGDDKQ